MSTYTISTATVTFTASAESWSEQVGSEVGVLAFPGGDAVAISLAGQREIRRTFKALLANASDYRKLRDMRNRQGWLQVDVWDTVPVQATLERISPDPIQTDGQVYAQVQFVLY